MAKIWTVDQNALRPGASLVTQTPTQDETSGNWTIVEQFAVSVPDADVQAYLTSIGEQITQLETNPPIIIASLEAELENYGLPSVAP